jgi:type II secretory pathway pseudopilin PulG
MRRRQYGVSLIFVVVALVGVAIMFFAMATLFSGSSGGARSSKTAASFAAAGAALEQFAGTSGRLPCPADPTASTGDAAPNAGAAACTFPMGTIPWKTIGMRSEDALDAWGWKISYRVFSGATGLTQEGGASMVNCDTSNALPGGGTAPTPSSLAPGGLCGFAHDHTDQQFLLNKGLRINDFGANKTDLAYVLMSHGPSGMGAYTSTGVRKALPTSADELANINTTNATGQFIAKAPNTQGIAPDAATYFDDVLASQSIRDLVKRANLAARDWPENFTAGSSSSVTMDAATVAAALGRPGTPMSPGDTGTDTIDFFTGTAFAGIQAFDAGGNANLTYDTTGGAPNIGVAGNGSNLMTSFGGERLRIDFSAQSRKFGVALADFGISNISGTNFTERVEFRFYNAGTELAGSPIVKSACAPDGKVATFALDPGGNFNRVDIRPLAATPFGITATALADIRTCPSSTADCFSNLDTGLTPAGNRCP